MAIQSLRGNIIEVAPDKVEALALWIFKGYNARYSLWAFEIPELVESVELIQSVSTTSNRREFLSQKSIHSSDMNIKHPWNHSSDSIWKLIPNINQTKYVYLFSNPGNSQGYKEFGMVRDAINRCLTQLSLLKVKSLAMIHIPASESENFRSPESEERSATIMIDTINQWMVLNEYEFDVYLVDRTDDFMNQL